MEDDLLVGVDTKSSTDGDEINVVVSSTDTGIDCTGEAADVEGGAYYQSSNAAGVLF